MLLYVNAFVIRPTGGIYSTPEIPHCVRNDKMMALLQHVANKSSFCHQGNDCFYANAFRFHAQHFITIFQIEIDFVIGKSFGQHSQHATCLRWCQHVGTEYFNRYHEILHQGVLKSDLHGVT